MPKEDDAIRQAEYLLENISKSLDSIASSIREISDMIELATRPMEENDE
jgi:hypothetical protein|tara:strand:+ start:418 stop:564 length:147 start_codon:yes stop_codon:yes gene_type:complete